MRQLFATFILASTVLLGCAKDVTVRTTATDLYGTYYSGDGLGRMVTVNLQADGTYQADWEGCLGVYGESRGSWHVVDERITFEPASESDMMVGHLTKATTIRYEGQLGFVREEDVNQERVSEVLVFVRQADRK